MKTLKLKNLIEIKTGFQIRTKLTPIDEGSHRVIQMRNICTETGRILDDVEFCRVTPTISYLDRYLLKKGDVLFLTRGNNYPAILITEEYIDFVAAGQFMVLTLNSDECLPEYLCWFINSPESKFYFAREARGTAVQIIGKRTVEDLLIPLPNLQTQRSIVELSRLATQEEQLLDSLKEKRKRLIYAQCKQKLREC